MYPNPKIWVSTHFRDPGQDKILFNVGDPFLGDWPVLTLNKIKPHKCVCSLYPEIEDAGGLP